eukprot:222103_1
MIKSLNSASIHKICSSQVITSLATAVKELVENSLDAGATQIDILLKKYGKESFTVSDDGGGIDPSDFELIASKHATSKLQSFEDLESLQSFGFRGEALSSLSALCGLNLKITTKRMNSSIPFGFELEYNQEGKLIKNKKIAYSKSHGTSVTVSQLFKRLPVRFKDFTKNIKKEYSHLLSVLQSYAIIQTNVSFVVRNDNKIVLNTARNSKNTKNSGDSVKKNLANIFGWKLMDKLTKIDAKTIELNDTTAVTLNGFISDAMMDGGRVKRDIQFFYLNKRPIDIASIQKLMNQIYKSNINRHKYPIIVLNMELLAHKYDINIDPNKRSVFIQNEGILLQKLREFIEELYEPQNMSFTVQSLDSFISVDTADNGSRKRKLSERSDGDSPPRKQRRKTVCDKVPIVSINPNKSETKPKSMKVAFEQQQVSLPINTTRFVSAFRALIGLRSHYKRTHKETENEDECIDYGDEDKLDLSLDKMKRILCATECVNMDIIGQFNKGFIIASSGDDIFIIDQHASDEKYRFEKLMKNHTMKSQRLLIPKYVECLTVQQEIAIIENINVFEQNGFKFKVDETRNNGERVQIVALPMSLNPHSKISYEFGEDEILELATLLSENTVFSLMNHNGNMIRPSKVRTVFAYRACRGAIMIGKALTKQQMREVVDNICTLDQPWNCPHGRPTMRHLFDLSLLTQHCRDRGQINAFGPFAFA